MAATEVVVRGALTADGQLVLDEKPDLPPGRVEVILRAAAEAESEGHPMFGTLRRIWAEQEARGFVGGRSLEEAVADVRALRDEWGRRDARIEESRQGCGERREAGAGGSEGI